MSTTRLGPHDVAATLIVAALAALFGFSRSGVDIAGMGSTRAVAATVLALGLVACAAGARNDAFTTKTGAQAMPAITRFLSLLGFAALGVGIAAIVTRSETLLATLVVLTLALWLSATIRHLVVPVPPRVPAPLPAATQPTAIDHIDRIDHKTHVHAGGGQR